MLQEVFAASYNALLADDRPINARPWLYRIARNRCLNHLRKPTAVGQDSMDIFERDDGATTAETVHRREEFRQIVGDVQELPETQRTALLLREIDALSYDQIAEAMDTTVPSVKSLLVRARVSLAEASEARLLTCEEVRLELGQVAEGLARTSPPVRRHLKSCERCRTFRTELRNTTKALAAVFPVGPFVILKKLGIAKLGFGGRSRRLGRHRRGHRAGRRRRTGGRGRCRRRRRRRRVALGRHRHDRLEGRRRHGRRGDRHRRRRRGQAGGSRPRTIRRRRHARRSAIPARAAPVAAPVRPGRGSGDTRRRPGGRRRSRARGARAGGRPGRVARPGPAGAGGAGGARARARPPGGARRPAGPGGGGHHHPSAPGRTGRGRRRPRRGGGRRRRAGPAAAGSAGGRAGALGPSSASAAPRSGSRRPVPLSPTGTLAARGDDRGLRDDRHAGRAGLAVEDFPEARKPAWKLLVDFGEEIGEKRSSAQIKHYSRSELEGRLVVAVVNFPPRQIGPVLSEVLVLGVPDEEGRVILLHPDADVPLGGGCSESRGPQATGVSPITFSRRSSAFIAYSRVSSTV